MFRTRSLVPVLLMLCIVAAPALAQSAKDAEVQELKQKIADLEKRISRIETQVPQQMAKLEQKLSQGGAAAPNPLENEATTALNAINRDVAFGKMEDAKNKMSEFTKKYASTKAAQSARRLQKELEVIGKAVPTDWGIEKWYQGEVDLANGKTTLLVFWEEWCPHCRREVPKMQNLYTSLKGDGLQVVGLTRITKSSTEEKVQSFISKEKVAYPLAKENGSVASHFNVSGIPAAAVIKDGKVIWRGHPAKINEAMLRPWM